MWLKVISIFGSETHNFFQTSSAGAIRSPPAMWHCLEHTTTCKIQNCHQRAQSVSVTGLRNRKSVSVTGLRKRQSSLRNSAKHDDIHVTETGCLILKPVTETDCLFLKPVTETHCLFLRPVTETHCLFFSSLYPDNFIKIS